MACTPNLHTLTSRMNRLFITCYFILWPNTTIWCVMSQTFQSGGDILCCCWFGVVTSQIWPLKTLSGNIVLDSCPSWMWLRLLQTVEWQTLVSHMPKPVCYGWYFTSKALATQQFNTAVYVRLAHTHPTMFYIRLVITKWHTDQHLDYSND